MAWTPTYKVIQARQTVPNLFTYFETNQADALLWAHGSALIPFQEFSDGVQNRAFPIFPSIAFKRDSSRTVGDGEVLQVEYSVVFEMVIENATPGAAVAQARSYLTAIQSMMANIPDATLLANTDANAVTTIEIADNFEEVKSIENKTFFQEFEVGATFVLTGSMFE